MAPSGRRPKTEPDDLDCESACTIVHAARGYSARKLILIYRPTEGRRLSRPGWLVTYTPTWFTRPQTVTHLGINRVWRSATTLIEANTLPLSQTANRRWTYCFQWNTQVNTFTFTRWTQIKIPSGKFAISWQLFGILPWNLRRRYKTE